MKNIAGRTAVAALAGAMTVSLFAGCGEKKLDGNAVAATVNGTDIQMGTLSLAARYQQAQTESMYLSFFGSASDIWDNEDEETGKTYGEQAVEDVLLILEQNEILRQKASEYGIELTEEDQTAIADAAAAFMKANTEEAIEELAITEDQVKTYLELATYQVRMQEAIYEEANVEVTEEEAQQSGFTYISVATTGDGITEEDAAKRTEQAQEILDKVKADPAADMDAIAKESDETFSALAGTFSTNVEEDEEESSYPAEVIEVLKSLEEGEVAEEIIEAEDNLYIVRLDSMKDEEATDSKKESLKEEKEMEYYTEKLDEWVEAADITEDNKVIEKLTITDNHKFTIQIPETAEDESEDISDESEIVEEDEVLELDEMTEEELAENGIQEIESEDAEEELDGEESVEEMEEPVEESTGEMEEAEE